MNRINRVLRIATAVAVTGGVAHAAPGGPGSVTGTVAFDGPAPERARLERGTDPYCARTEALSEDVIVTAGKLKDVVVRVVTGPAARPAKAPPPAVPLPPAVIDQRGCAYAPHVLGVVAGQALAARNSDGTFHNVHGTIAGTLAWNKPASPGDPALALDNPGKPGDVIDVVCDVHPWMHAYAMVTADARFAVTGADGAFQIPDLAPGTYTLEAWHPVLGKQTAKVVIAGKAATVTFTYGRK